MRYFFLLFPRIFSDFFLILLGISLAYGFHSYFLQFFGPIETHVDIQLSWTHLPIYTFYSLSRGLCAYFLSLVFSLTIGYWAAKDQFAEKILIPLLDLLQSIPILGFIPGVVLILISWFPNTNAGLELAAILLMFTGQVWNMVFGVYHSMRMVPVEKEECATAYRFSAFQRMIWIEAPFAALSLVWNSIISMAGGWFFLMVNEAFTLGNRDFRIPGLGSYMSVAANRGDVSSMIGAIVSMICLIVFLDQLLWRPLVVWSQKFRVEETTGSTNGTTWFLTVLKNSYLIQIFFRFVKSIFRYFARFHSNSQPNLDRQKLIGLILSRGLIVAILFFVCFAAIRLGFFFAELGLEKWAYLFKMALLTFCRVLACLTFGVLVAVPLGLAIGLSEKWSRIFQPIVQIGASFPATLLFPALIVFFLWIGIPLGIGSIFLMYTGTIWYILYNVLAGAKAMPSDLREVAANFSLNRRMKFFKLYLPSIFPYLVTGLLAGSGGAWNASIVSEYVNYKGKNWSTPGLGSTISFAAQTGDTPLLITSVLVMMLVVVALNYGIWLRLYHYSEKHFAINT